MTVQVGYMPMPLSFKYMDVFLKGKPCHDGWDAFTIRHPPMPASRWAKIYSPFDALRGFDEAIKAKEAMEPEQPGLPDDAPDRE